MQVHTDSLWFTTAKRQEFVRITDEVASIVGRSGVQEGIVQVFDAEFDGQRKKRVVVKVMGI